MRTVKVADLFCGAGGSSTGLLRAARKLGLKVDLLAVNHWPEALATHELNHPGVRHLQEDLGMIDPRRAVPGGVLDLLWASPECTSHSYSRGGRPISEQSRASAWHPLKWCDQLNVKTVIIENVPAFRAWGPTDRNGNPIKKRRGETYRQFIEMLRAMGYAVEARVLNSADYGAAQTRRRLFIVGVKGARRNIKWPVQTHAPAGSLLPGLRPWRGAKEIIDWSIRGKSIFNRKKPHAPKTLERILIGLEKYGPALRPYIPILRNHLLPRSVDDPVPTVAANGTHIGLAEPVLVQVSHGDGNGRGNTGRTRSIDSPFFSLTGSRELGFAEPIIMVNRTNNVPKSTEDPLSVLNTGGHMGLVEPIIVTPGGSWEDRPQSIQEPLRTIIGRSSKALVEPFILPHRVYDKMTADSINDPLRTLTTTGRDMGVVEPYLIPFNGEREGQPPRSHSINEPLPTVTTGGAGQKGLAEAVLLKYSRTGGARSTGEPLDTLTTKPRYGLVTPELLAQYDGLPIGTLTPIGIKICPDLYLDILFRMLRVHELGQGQGFPRNYQFTGTVEEQVKQVGNAVEVHQAEALCIIQLEDLFIGSRLRSQEKRRVVA